MGNPKGDIGNYFVKIIDKTAYFSCDTCKNFLTFTCENSQTIALSNIGNNTPIIEYSFDKLTWTLLDSTPVSFGNGTDIYVRGNNPNGLSKSASIYSKFVLGNSNATECTGNIMALINYTNNELSEIPCSYCFYKLFEGCTGLTKGPDLLCEELTNNCYSYMFNGCTSLNYIKALFLNEPSTSYMDNWVNNVASTGSIILNNKINWDPYQFIGISGIPNGWIIKYDIAPLKFTCTGNQTIAIQNNGSNNPNLEYSYDLLTWNTLSTTAISFGNGTDIYVRGNNPNGLSSSESKYTNFVFGNTNLVNWLGNVMSLINYNDKVLTIPCNYCFFKLFYNCTQLLTAPELPATTLASNCYYSMFNGCTSLVTAPVLPATTLEYQCYANMFYNCNNLNYIKALFLTTPSLSYTSSWVSNVASTGTFVKNSSATWDVRGVNGIPTNWTVQTASE